MSRRQLVCTATALATGSTAAPAAVADVESRRGSNRFGPLREVVDPESYSALVYSPAESSAPLPLLLVLHGAGMNDQDAWALADPRGEHAGLPPSLLASGRAPPALARRFAMAAPYAAGRRSFYEEPRQKLLRFVSWVCSDAGRAAGCPRIDPARIFVLGFSDGATVGVELLTSARLAGGIIAAYGFTGALPPQAVDQLHDKPVWVFHSADDVIFSVSNSDRLVSTLRDAAAQPSVVRYSRFDADQEGFTGTVRGHSTGVTASKRNDVYEWLLGF